MSTQSHTQNYQEVYDWLHAQAETLGLHISFLTSETRLQSGLLYLPTRIEGSMDSYENALKLQKLEDTWNDREPQPEPSLFLVPAKDPLRKAAWERVTSAMQRKMQAITAFGNAATREDQEKAAAEFHAAEQEEQEAQKDYEQILPWNERTA